MCCVGLPDASAPLWQLMQLAVMPAWSKRAGSQALVVWQFWQASLLGMCGDPLPIASTPSWQLAQLLVTPACEYEDARTPRVPADAATPRGTPRAGAAPAAPGAMAAATAGAATTVPIVLRVGAWATAFLFAALSPQLFVLWQPLQSLVDLLPELWSPGRVCRFVTP